MDKRRIFQGSLSLIGETDSYNTCPLRADPSVKNVLRNHCS
jgi:hypothetical protein